MNLLPNFLSYKERVAIFKSKRFMNGHLLKKLKSSFQIASLVSLFLAFICWQVCIACLKKLFLFACVPLVCEDREGKKCRPLIQDTKTDWRRQFAAKMKNLVGKKLTATSPSNSARLKKVTEKVTNKPFNWQKFQKTESVLNDWLQLWAVICQRTWKLLCTTKLKSWTFAYSCHLVNILPFVPLFFKSAEIFLTTLLWGGSSTTSGSCSWSSTSCCSVPSSTSCTPSSSPRSSTGRSGRGPTTFGRRWTWTPRRRIWKWDDCNCKMSVANTEILLWETVFVRDLD